MHDSAAWKPLWTGSAALTPLAPTTDTSTIPGPGTIYDVRLADLVSHASDYSNDLVSGFDGAVDNILTDYGKLNKAGVSASNTDLGWSIDNLTKGDAASMSIINGARMSMWTQMLPQLYGLRVATGMDSSNPATFGTRYRDKDYLQCGSVYAPYASGPVPATSMTAFNHVGDGESSKWDVNIIAEQPTWNYGYGVTIDDPMSKDLSTMLTTTQVVSSLEDGGSAGAEHSCDGADQQRPHGLFDICRV